MRRTTTDDTLTADAFTAALAELGWKQTDFARKTGLSLSAVNRWATGQTPVPLWAGAYLGAMLDLAALHRKYIEPERPASARLAHHLENPASPAPD